MEPDFRTISDFRKDNIDSLKKIFQEFNRRISGAVEWGFTSIDGSKFLANNSKDNNFTKNKLDDRIKWLNAHTDEYLRILKEMDEQEELEEVPENLTKETLEAKLKEPQESLARYEAYQKLMEDTGVSQLSLTDADARLMKNKNGFAVAYNPQTAVDSATHLIRDFEMTNQVTDHGLLSPTMSRMREEEPDKILETVADKGYENAEDMLQCLENGIIPHVIMEDGEDAVFRLGVDFNLPTGYKLSNDRDQVTEITIPFGSTGGHTMVVEKGDLSSIVKIQFVDAENNDEVVAGGDYFVDGDGDGIFHTREIAEWVPEGYELQEVGDFQVELYKETPLQLSVTKIKEEIPMTPLEPSKPETPDKEDNKKEDAKKEEKKKNSPKTGDETNAAAAALPAGVSLAAILAVLVKKFK